MGNSLLILCYIIFPFFFFPAEVTNALKTIHLTLSDFPTYKPFSNLLAEIKSEELNFDEIQ